MVNKTRGIRNSIFQLNYAWNSSTYINMGGSTFSNSNKLNTTIWRIHVISSKIIVSMLINSPHEVKNHHTKMQIT